MNNDQTWIGSSSPRNAGGSGEGKERPYVAVDQQHLVALFEQSALGIVYLAATSGDERGWRWELCNQRFCAILGYTQEEVLAATMQQFILPEDLPRWYAALQDMYTPQSFRSCDIHMIGKAHVQLKLHFMLSSVTSSVGAEEDRRLLVGFVDVVEEERAEAQEHEVALHEANQRMEDFLGIASHELRTPLTTIKANIQLAMRRLRSLLQEVESLPQNILTRIEAAHDMLFRAEWQVGVLNRLVSDLIDISHIQTDRLQLYLRQEPCDLLQIVKNSIIEQRKASPERIIDVSLPDADVLVLADPDRIGQVLTNYLTNALKYSESNKPVTVTVLLERLASGVPGVMVSVHDEGPGVPEAEQVRIWECFYQSQDVRVQSGSGVGLGLGLYISQMIIERHGGSVGVTSQLKRGSTFWFTLPLALL